MIKELGNRLQKSNQEQRRRVSINYSVLWLESNRMVSHFLSFSYFTQYQQFQRQSSIQSCS